MRELDDITEAKRGFHVERQTAVRFEYDGLVFEEGFRTDLIVDHQVIVELKSVERLVPVHGKKLLTHLRLNDFPPLRVAAPPREPIGAKSVAGRFN